MDLSANHILVVFLLTTLAGLATGIGGFIAFFMKRTDTKTLTFSLGFSGGVMVYISLVELLGEAQHRLMEFEGHTAGAWIAIASFFGGIAVAALIDYLVPEDENPHEARGPEDIHGQGSGEFSSSKIKRSGILFAGHRHPQLSGRGRHLRRRAGLPDAGHVHRPGRSRPQHSGRDCRGGASLLRYGQP